MSAFRVSAAGLLRLATEGSLADRVAEQVWMSGHGVSPAERKSWSRSRSVLAGVHPKTGKGSPRLKNVFLYFNSFTTADRNGIDVLICDEAHRIRETSVSRFTRSAQRQGARAQLEELLAAARVPVFLLDEHQVVKPGELGDVDVITAYAKRPPG